MIYVDSKFRFYDDSKDLVKFPELAPVPEAVPLTDEQVQEITANISLWRWHPVEAKPYKVPDCDKKYWKTVDGVILEMTTEEKAAVDQAEADALAAKLAAEQAEAARIAAKAQAFIDNLPSWSQVETAVKAAFPDAKQQAIMLKICRVVYWLAKDQKD